jgi:hypothetical protein
MGAILKGIPAARHIPQRDRPPKHKPPIVAMGQHKQHASNPNVQGKPRQFTRHAGIVLIIQKSQQTAIDISATKPSKQPIGGQQPIKRQAIPVNAKTNSEIHKDGMKQRTAKTLLQRS